MRKFITLFLSLEMSVGTLFAWDYEQVQIGSLFYNLDAANHVAEVGRNSAASGHVIIPAFVAYNEIEYSVTCIESLAFSGCSNLISVSISNNVTTIGYSAFAGCSMLTSVEFPNSIVNCAHYVFQNCNNITTPIYNSRIFAYMPSSFSGMYMIPDGIEIVASGSFAYCENITSIIIPSSVICIKGQAFFGCSNLQSISFGENVEIIEHGAFCGCTNLQEVRFPNSIRIISHGDDSGTGAFQGCISLTSIDIPNSVTTIGNHAFSQCSGLTSINIPNSVTTIGNYAFSECSGLTSINIPNSVTTIGNYAFSQCSGLTLLTIPNSVTSIGSEAFRNCNGLISVTNYATSPQTISSYVFCNVDKSTCTLYVPKESVDLYKAADGWKEFMNIVAIPDSIETIEGDYTIYYMDKENQDLSDEVVTLHVPSAPSITGFTFVEWRASGTLEDGIILQAVYQADIPSSAPEVYPNPANPAQKLIKNGNVYILSEDKTYTIIGQQVK